MTDWTSLDYAVIDVEGNGQQPPDLVELAVVPIRSGVVGEPASWLVRPGGPITHFATRIHRLKNEDVARAPLFTDIADQVLAALDVPALVAHNAHVDVDVLNRKLAGWLAAARGIRHAADRPPSPARPGQLPARRTHQRLPPG